jgi:hypothetical protein
VLSSDDDVVHDNRLGWPPFYPHRERSDFGLGDAMRR